MDMGEYLRTAGACLFWIFVVMSVTSVCGSLRRIFETLEKIARHEADMLALMHQEALSTSEYRQYQRNRDRKVQ